MSGLSYTFAPMKKYTAVLIQSGAVPPQELFAKSDFIKPVVWARVDEGTYKGTCADGWAQLRTHVMLTATADGTVLHASAIITDYGEITLYFNNEGSVNTINLEITYFL